MGFAAYMLGTSIAIKKKMWNHFLTPKYITESSFTDNLAETLGRSAKIMISLLTAKNRIQHLTTAQSGDILEALGTKNGREICFPLSMDIVWEGFQLLSAVVGVIQSLVPLRPAKRSIWKAVARVLSTGTLFKLSGRPCKVVPSQFRHNKKWFEVHN